MMKIVVCWWVLLSPFILMAQESLSGKIIIDENLFREIIEKNTNLISQSYSEKAGYIRFSNDYFSGDMNRAWQVVSETITPNEMADLKWENAFLGTTTEYSIFRDLMQKTNGTLDRHEWFGQRGLKLLSKKYLKINKIKSIEPSEVETLISKIKSAANAEEQKFLGWSGYETQEEFYERLEDRWTENWIKRALEEKNGGRFDLASPRRSVKRGTRK